MSAIQLANVMAALVARSEASRASGGDGFVPTSTVCMRVGLCTRSVRRVLDARVNAGDLERRACGQGYSYRPVMRAT